MRTPVQPASPRRAWAAAAAFSARTTGAYARIREQFGIPIGKFEGVQERMGAIAATAYQLDAARRLTCAGLDSGRKLAVISAIMKSHATDRMRQAVNDAMDVHAGKAVIDGHTSLLRTLRVLRAFRTIKSIRMVRGLQMIVSTVFRSLPDMGNIFLLLGIVMFIFAVAGVNIFGHDLPARHVVHTVGPRYQARYTDAAESALHWCYRGSLQLCAEAGAAWSKWPSWWGHSWPPRSPLTASEGLGLPSALGRRGPAPRLPQRSLGSGATPRPRRRSR